jgi:hypothetical protein
MSLPEDSLVPQNDIPPVLPENISANSESSNPFSTPKALDQNQFTGIQGKAAALGIGYWILVVAGFLITAVAVTQEPFMGIPLGWVATFSALRVPLRDLRRNALSSPPRCESCTSRCRRLLTLDGFSGGLVFCYVHCLLDSMYRHRDWDQQPLARWIRFISAYFRYKWNILCCYVPLAFRCFASLINVDLAAFTGSLIWVGTHTLEIIPFLAPHKASARNA